MDLKEIKDLIALLNEMALTEIEVEEAGRRIRIRKDAPMIAQHLSPLQPEPTQETPALTEKEEERENFTFVTSPIVGTFYKATSPDANPYVGIGDTVRKGQTLCIVEAMKLMNEIEADVDGKIIAILAEDGASVEYGEALYKIEPA
ncbi:MAG: acetyl-CoA carboxylase biotin carboxyl carrier protein [Nitrospira sp.]|nr:acetyl-CoA carboxylase biotin carboxyl carrier protein [Candidatus Manganitrophaceae bacterium]HIL34275.1 acetyl-CoA carboxylase biotin carboxyl carrier protein [Candidatus Manganitrophaceae bacterium]